MRRLLPAARFLLALLVITTCTVAGTAAGLVLGGSSERDTSFARLTVDVVPSRNGHVTVFVPLVDWKVGLLEHAAPVDVEVEVRGIDRTEVGEGISSSAAASRSLETIRNDSVSVIERGVRRAAVAAATGGMAGALVAGLLIGVLTLRRRWAWMSLVVGVLVTTGLVGTSLASLARLDASDVQPTADGGNADELPVVLRFAEQLLYAGDEYEGHYETALDSIENLIRFTNASAPGRSDRSAFVVSDIHDNVFVLGAFDELAEDDTVFAVGDFVQVGAAIEDRTAPRIAQLGGEVVAISGNHDSTSYMEELAESGATVLGEDRSSRASRHVHDVEGLRIAAYPDPLERQPGARGAHVLRVYGAQYEEQVAEFLRWFDELEQWPDIVLVHQHGLAHRLAKQHRASGDPRLLQIFTGHDHKAHVHHDETTLIVNGGTLGAGGFAAIGEQDASFARVHFDDTTVVAVDLVSVEPLTGRASAERIRIDSSK